MSKLPKNKFAKSILIIIILVVVAILFNYIIYILYNHTTIFDPADINEEVLIKVIPFDKTFYEFEFTLIKENGVTISKKINQNYLYEFRVHEPIEFKSTVKRKEGHGIIELEIWDNTGLRVRENVQKNDNEINLNIDFQKFLQ